ncbi:DUF3341 domain-containing protein [bacterium]|nr:DUF3341 domain-containing protein [bacterium]
MPESSGSLQGMVGVFDDPTPLLHMAGKARDAGWKHWDCHTPYPVHGLEKAMGLRDSLIPFLTISAGFFGAVFAKGMQWYMSDYDFPVIVGGKPLFSLPAFVPVTFELFVLFAALTTFGSVILFCGLCRWHSPLHDANLMLEATSDRYVVWFDATDALFEESEVRKFLEGNGAGDVRVVYNESDRRSVET